MRQAAGNCRSSWLSCVCGSRDCSSTSAAAHHVHSAESTPLPCSPADCLPCLLLLLLQALCEHEEAEQLLRTAAGVCFEVQLQAAELAPGTARKLQVLLDVLHAQGSAAAC